MYYLTFTRVVNMRQNVHKNFFEFLCYFITFANNPLEQKRFYLSKTCYLKTEGLHLTLSPVY